MACIKLSIHYYVVVNANHFDLDFFLCLLCFYHLLDLNLFLFFFFATFDTPFKKISRISYKLLKSLKT
jgi:hypothetical protein